jgi:hypothetical protein
MIETIATTLTVWSREFDAIVAELILREVSNKTKSKLCFIAQISITSRRKSTIYHALLCCNIYVSAFAVVSLSLITVQFVDRAARVAKVIVVGEFIIHGFQQTPKDIF